MYVRVSSDSMLPHSLRADVLQPVSMLCVTDMPTRTLHVPMTSLVTDAPFDCFAIKVWVLCLRFSVGEFRV